MELELDKRKLQLKQRPNNGGLVNMPLSSCRHLWLAGGRANTLHTVHCIPPLLGQKERHWGISGRLGRYQAVLLDRLSVNLKALDSVKSATRLPTEEPIHYYIQIIEDTYSSGYLLLLDQPLEHPDLEMFTDRRSFWTVSRRPPKGGKDTCLCWPCP
jgi:hypothetical protein